ncbi:mRNA triphosphatase CET1 [Multifurca ochricompacta]|uniref:mRNA-capping enzyme subunit beta n=1 Tax=Multifurca ochricompacta TaxID=376703 RepID=A0AAD4QNW9_9AGAM|nr:mRNA triphosphatase CET1 [Multifurca ochricompacta]
MSLAQSQTTTVTALQNAPASPLPQIMIVPKQTAEPLHLADFIHHSIITRPPDLQGDIEVEAKIGVLKDRGTGNRLQLPVLVETILTSKAAGCHFESNMTGMQHKHFNMLLNNLKESSDKPGYHSSPIAYTHSHLVDSFYASENPRSRENIRVTRDDKTGEVLATVKKVRLGNLDVYNPKRAADWRISVNVEVPVPHPLGSPTHTRRKDRISYSHEEFVIDLTQVASSGGPGSQPELLHELELEFANPRLLAAAAAKRGDESSPEPERFMFDELIRVFVNNARILARNSAEGWQ